jgi:amino acid permease
MDPNAPFDPTSKAFFQGALMRACLVGLSGLVVVAIPDFAAIMGLIGSTCCMLLALILPGYFHLKIFGNRLTLAERCFDYFVVGLGMVGFILGTHDAIERILSADPSEDG